MSTHDSKKDTSDSKKDTSATPSNVSRRNFIRTLGGAAVGLGAVASGVWPRTSFAAPRAIRIGYVTPETGPLAPFAATDLYVVKQMRDHVFKHGITIGGHRHPVEIHVKDSQSNPNRAASVASDLILNDNVDLMLVDSAPETTNPVSDQCELNGVPCIATVAPWQDWFFIRGGKPNHPFQYTYLFFWGVEDVERVYTSMWHSLHTNKIVGGLWANDIDGDAWGKHGHLWGTRYTGFPPVLKKEGFKLIDPGRFPDGAQDFSTQISQFKQGDCQIVTGNMIPPDVKTFWTQAGQDGYEPVIVTIGKGLLFPQSVDSLGDRGAGLSCEVWWTPSHPFHSSLTGQSARQLATAWEKASGKQWTQPLGYSHALFEVAVDALKRTQDLDKPDSIAQAIKETKLSTIVGKIDWSTGPVPNVAKTPLVGGQWKHGDKYKYDLKIVDNKGASNIPVQAKLEPIRYS